MHVKLRAKGHDELTTQLYFAGDPYNASDPFIVDSLIMHRGDPGGGLDEKRDASGRMWPQRMTVPFPHSRSGV